MLVHKNLKISLMDNKEKKRNIINAKEDEQKYQHLGTY